MEDAPATGSHAPTGSQGAVRPVVLFGAVSGVVAACGLLIGDIIEQLSDPAADPQVTVLLWLLGPWLALLWIVLQVLTLGVSILGAVAGLAGWSAVMLRQGRTSRAALNPGGRGLRRLGPRGRGPRRWPRRAGRSR